MMVKHRGWVGGGKCRTGISKREHAGSVWHVMLFTQSRVVLFFPGTPFVSSRLGTTSSACFKRLPLSVCFRLFSSLALSFSGTFQTPSWTASNSHIPACSSGTPLTMSTRRTSTGFPQGLPRAFCLNSLIPSGQAPPTATALTR